MSHGLHDRRAVSSIRLVVNFEGSLILLIHATCQVFRKTIASAATTLVLLGCSSAESAVDHPRFVGDSARTDSIARAHQDSIDRATPGYVIDSLLPVEEELRRFREVIGGSPVIVLQHASSSREALVRRFVRDLATHDTADLGRAAVSPREFADLIYPDSPNTRPPYRQSPAFVWMQ